MPNAHAELLLELARGKELARQDFDAGIRSADPPPSITNGLAKQGYRNSMSGLLCRDAGHEPCCEIHDVHRPGATSFSSFTDAAGIRHHACNFCLPAVRHLRPQRH